MTIIKKTKGIQGKLIISFVMLTVIINLVTGIIQYKADSKKILEDDRQKIIKLATAAALLVDGDKHERLGNKEGQLNDIYKEIRTQMLSFQKDIEVKYVYTLIKGEDNKTQFIVDANVENLASLGLEYDYLEDMESAFNGIASADKNVTTDEFGTVLSGYAPIKNSEGKVVAIVGVDMDVSYILEQKGELVRSIVINGIVSMILTLILAILLSRRIIKPIHYLAKRFEELSLAGGDLTQKIEIKTGDELEVLGSAVTNFISNIRDMVQQVTDNAEDVANSADNLNIYIGQTQRSVGEVTNAIQGIAAGAADQAGDVNDISYLIQEIASNINENERKVNVINNSAKETRKLIDNGINAVNNQTVKTEENLNAFKKVTEVVEKLAKEAKEVETILLTITNISEQTNLLALNAAIEAARAGEQGKGFSIVADEVRKLAEESTIAVGEIGEILQKINVDTKDAIEEINNADLIAKEQKVAVDSTSVTFKNMTNEVEDMISSIDTISKSFKDIAKNTNNIADKIQGVSSISEENAAIVEEVSASAEEQNTSMDNIGATAENLDNLSQKLKGVISKFKI